MNEKRAPGVWLMFFTAWFVFFFGQILQNNMFWGERESLGNKKKRDWWKRETADAVDKMNERREGGRKEAKGSQILKNWQECSSANK